MGKRKGYGRRPEWSRICTRRVPLVQNRSSGEPAASVEHSAHWDLSFRFFPNPTLMHQCNLFFCDLFVVRRVFQGLALHVEILGIDRLFVDNLIELSAKVLHPVVPLGARAMITQGLDVDDSGNVT